MKKLLALFLSISIIFMLTSCSFPDKPCTEHTDIDKNHLCDTCGADVTPKGLTFSNAILSQLNGTKSMKLDIEVKVTVEESVWCYEYDKINLTLTNPVQEACYDDTVVNASLAISLNTNGSVNAKIDAKVKKRDSKTKAYEIEDLGTVIYIIENTVYVYDEDNDGYIVQENTDTEEITRILTALFDGVESPTPNDEQLTKLGDLIITTFDIKEYRGGVSIDAKPMIDEFFAYITALDMEKDTVEGVLDDALALINKELNTAKLIAELERVADLTVNEALAEVDEKLIEKYNTTLQGIYNSLIADENVMTVVENYLEMMLTNGKGGELSVADKAKLTTTLGEIKGFKITEAIEELGIGEIKLYDLILNYVIGIEPNKAMTVEELFDYVDRLADMTLTEFENESGSDIFTSLKEVASRITVNTLNAKLDINFKGIFEIDNIAGTVNVDVVNSTPSIVQGKNNESKIAISITFKLYDLSKDTISITVPNILIQDGISLPSIDVEFN